MTADYKTRAEQGIRSSAEHAEEEVPGWGERVLIFIGWYARSRERTGFTMDECRQACYSIGLPSPPDERAWGSATRKAIQQEIIHRTGHYAPVASSNGSPKPLYVGRV